MLVTVLVLGVFIPVVQATTGAANEVRAKVIADVYLKPRTTEAEMQRVKRKIERTEHVGRVVFISKAQAYKEERKRNPEAYDLYLRGMDYLARTNQQPDLRNAAHFFEQAVKADPSFAQAHARLSRVDRLAGATAPWKSICRKPPRKLTDRSSNSSPFFCRTRWAPCSTW